jgi:CelD/BcsL family acetyltransferase involved in cellulose biosynthesis
LNTFVPRPLVLAAPGPLTATLIDDLAGLAALEAEWRTLADDPAGGAGFFQGFDFIRLAFAEALAGADAGRPLIAVARDWAGAIALILPLLVKRKRGVRIAGWLGGSLVAGGDGLAPPGADIAAAAALLRRTLAKAGVADLLHLRYVSDTARIAPWVKAAALARTEHGPAPYLTLDARAGFPALYEARISKTERSKRGRKRRRLAEVGPLRMDVTAASPQAVADLEHGLAMKRDWVAARGLHSGQLSDAYADRLMRACAAEHPGFECCTYRAGAEVLNFVLALRTSREVIYHLTVYNPAYERWSPGLIQLEDLIAGWMAHGVEIVDFGNGLNPYKLEWTDAAHAHFDYAVPLTLAGRAYAHASFHIADPILRKVYFSMPMALRAKALSMFKAIISMA